MTRPSRSLRLAALAGLSVLLTAMLATLPTAQALPASGASSCSSPCDISQGSSPLTHIYIGSDLSCQVVEGSTGQYDPTGSNLADCGTFVAVNGNLYGPSVTASVPGGVTPYGNTSGNQKISGNGSPQDPFQVTTEVRAGPLDVIEVDTYAGGLQTYKTRITVKNTGSTAVNGVKLYRAASCALNGATSGFGSVERFEKGSGHQLQLVSVDCVENNGGSPGNGVEAWVPNSVGTKYFEGLPTNLWNTLGNHGDLPDTCSGSGTAGACGGSPQNDAIGVEWNLSLSAGASVVRGDQTNLATNGNAPLTEVVTADRSGKLTTVNSHSLNGYGITIHNPTTASVDVQTITDYLPTGFTYRTGTTTGATTNDPSGSSTLTWSGPFPSVAPRSDLHLHFGVTVAGAGGKYYDAASATATAHEVAPTGKSAQIRVTQTYQLTVTSAGTGKGTVTSTPVGIKCPPVCTKAFTGGTVKLTPKKALGSRFTNWVGDCSGGTCSLTMNADHNVTANFDKVCTRIAYVKGNDILAQDAPGGGTLTTLVTSSGKNYDPAWSPNCSRLAFTSTRNGNPDIWVMDAGGNNPHAVGTSLVADTQPTWSADGTRIAFVSVRAGKPQIFSVGANGGPVRRVTHDKAADTQPDWSPVGKRIVFTSTAGGRAQLWSILSDGKSLMRISGSAGTNSQAAWSPTGTRLLFISTRDGNPEVYVMNANGSSPIRLTRTKTFTESHPTWSPAGGSFAFAKKQGSNTDVWTRTLAGASAVNITSSAASRETSPAWSS